MRLHILLPAVCLILAGCKYDEGCTDPEALNFHEGTTVDNGSCQYPEGMEPVLFDGHLYHVAIIGEQTWFDENLRTTTYANGEPIPSGLTDAEWFSIFSTEGQSAVYGEGNSPCNDTLAVDFDPCDEALSLEAYGRLYNWHAVNDPRGLCPEGWHVPTVEDWSNLEEELIAQGHETAEAIPLRSTDGWYNWAWGMDSFGFTALPGGSRNELGEFNYAGGIGLWWSATPSGAYAWRYRISHYSQQISPDEVRPGTGYSVRCLKD